MFEEGGLMCQILNALLHTPDRHVKSEWPFELRDCFGKSYTGKMMD